MNDDDRKTIRELLATHEAPPSPTRQVMLVGSSPLPLAVAAAVLQPSSVVLVYSPATKRPCDRLSALLTSWGIACESREVTKPHDAADVGRAVRSINPDWSDCGLHYTGGTKVMAVHARAAYASAGGTPKRATYLRSDGTFTWDSGPEIRLDRQVTLSLAALSALHIGGTLTAGNEHHDSNRSGIAARIHAFVTDKDKGPAAWRQLLPPVYYSGPTTTHSPSCVRWKVADVNAAKDANCADGEPVHEWNYEDVASILGFTAAKALDDILRTLPCGGTGNKDKRKKLLTWLLGDWLEVWLANKLVHSGQFDSVHQDVNVHTPGRDQFQCDVVAMRGFTTYLFSVTTDAHAQVKSKLFEARQRSERLGGEHARTALVSFAENPLQAFRSIHEEGWQGYDEDRCFGFAHVKGAEAPCFLNPDGTDGAAMTLLEAIEQWVKR